MSRAVAAVFLVFAGCATPSVGPSMPWVGWDEIQGPMRPEVVLGPGLQGSDVPISALRVVTFNVHHGKDVDGIARALSDHPGSPNADVVFIQEIQSYPSEGASRARKLAESLGMSFAYAPAKPFVTEGETGTHGNAILSRFPLENVAVMELPRGKIVINEERRIAMSADIRVNSTTVRLINVHLDTRLNATERILQLRPAVLDSPVPAIVAGDFNSNPMVWAFNVVPVIPLAAIPGSDQADILDDYMREIGFSTPTSRVGKTVSFPVVNARLDSVFLRGLDPGPASIDRTTSVSDHWPVWLTVMLPQQLLSRS